MNQKHRKKMANPKVEKHPQRIFGKFCPGCLNQDSPTICMKCKLQIHTHQPSLWNPIPLIDLDERKSYEPKSRFN